MPIFLENYTIHQLEKPMVMTFSRRQRSPLKKTTRIIFHPVFHLEKYLNPTSQNHKSLHPQNKTRPTLPRRWCRHRTPHL